MEKRRVKIKGGEETHCQERDHSYLYCTVTRAYWTSIERENQQVTFDKHIRPLGIAMALADDIFVCSTRQRPDRESLKVADHSLLSLDAHKSDREDARLPPGSASRSDRPR